MPVTALTAAQQRMINDYIPSLSAGHPPSFALADKLGDIIVQENTNETNLATLAISVNEIVSNTVNVPNGATSVLAGNFPGMDATPVAVGFADDFTVQAARACGATWDGGDNLTVFVDADPADAAGVNVSYIIDGR